MYVDDVPHGKYNSDTHQAEAFSPSPKALSEHLQKQTKYAQQYEVWQWRRMKFLMEFYNKTKGDGHIHVYQRKVACELHDDGTIGGYLEIAFDGKEFLVFDKKRVVYVPVTREAVMVSHLWNKLYDTTYSKMYMEVDCIEHIRIYLPFILTDLEKKGEII
ncbi:hypothetical protein XELAEV_18040575mg [Xenopus laevis]|uniref:MHC class I-like antigen recognition-like domain-containing protein n=1 Tax=Xenopus laevis TaxID=8355 RepID=A0A974C9V6_XENLA|nr:hypothetical protein XELAEV_18040575mg [Xenopus laevis]